MKVIIAAAGTAGHINPGIAIANKIKQENNTADITFIGTTRGLENDLVPRAGYKLKTIEAYGLSRKISFQNFKNILKTLKGFREAKKIVKEINPDIVIGTGGYICGPTLMAAVKNKIPTLVHESNSYPGVAVRLLSKKVDVVLVGFKEAGMRLPKAKKIVVTGNPTKMGFAKETAANSKQIVLVFGGSQGAKSINKALIEIIESSKKEALPYELIWACGPKQYDVIKEELAKRGMNAENIEGIKVVPYIHNMEEVMSHADIVVSRSGAMTITEVAMAGKPAIFVPFPFATENHQEYNAKVLENVGAAKIILDKDLNAKVLSKELNNMLKDPMKLKIMGEQAKMIAIPNTLDLIYSEIKERVKSSNLRR